MLDLAILGLLEQEELHGYEIRRRLRDRLGLWANVSFGSLYPALSRLERAGAVVGTSVGSRRREEPPPLTGSLSGERAVARARRLELGHHRRARKVYRLTDTGRRLFTELLAGDDGADDGRSFALRWAFAGRLDRAARISLLERRRAQLAQRRRDVAAAGGDPALDRYTRSAVEHAAETIECDIDWIDRQLAGESEVALTSAHGAAQADLHEKERT